MPNIRVTAKTYHIVGAFDRAAVELPDRVGRRERHYRARLQSRIIANASGRPGPERVTSEYVDSIEVRGPAVGTDHPAGRRLEFGYHGPDADGVTYDQPPYPHFQPAADEIRPAFFRSMERLVTELVTSYAGGVKTGLK